MEAEMTVGVVLEFEGATLAQYDQVLEKMGLAGRGPAPHGGLFHWAAKTDTGIVVTDVWENRDEFETFAAEKIQPLTAAVGFPAPPTVTFYEVHNYLTAG
jgi:hypothetical protein